MLKTDKKNTQSKADDFMVIVSHELRTPLAVLRLQLYSLRKTLKSMLSLKDIRLALNTALRLEKEMDRQLIRLESLIQNVIEASRASSGGMTLSKKSSDLAEILNIVLEELQPDLSNSRCSLSVNSERGLIGNWDFIKIKELIYNLISNAMKYGPGKPILIRLERGHDLAILSVQDFGIGIESDVQNRLFQRFERAISPLEFSGLGLGLYVAQSIAMAHGGKIKMESKKGEGTKFTVVLPFDRENEKGFAQSA